MPAHITSGLEKRSDAESERAGVEKILQSKIIRDQVPSTAQLGKNKTHEILVSLVFRKQTTLLPDLTARRRHVALRQSSRGSKHLVESEQSERFYLVT